MGVYERIVAGAELFANRNSEYGDAYKTHGEIMKAFFPDGVVLKSPSDFLRFGLVNAIVGKINRYARNFNAGGHADSLRDAGVYCYMLEEVDGENSKR